MRQLNVLQQMMISCPLPGPPRYLNRRMKYGLMLLAKESNQGDVLLVFGKLSAGRFGKAIRRNGQR